MAHIQAGPQPERNGILEALPSEEQKRIFPALEPVWLRGGKALLDGEETQQYVYFVIDAVISLQFVTGSGAAAQVAMIGGEGMVGVSHILEPLLPVSNAIVVNEGHAFRLPARTAKNEFGRGGALQGAVMRYVKALILQMAHAAVCNRHHTIDQQFARFLLGFFDRIDSDQVYITHQEISQLLGVRREGITEAARKLREAEVIAYKRGRLALVDRNNLERRTCDCYRSLRAEVGRLAKS